MKSTPHVAAVLAAAGAGKRFRQVALLAPAADRLADRPKVFLPLLGRPLWTHAALVLSACDEVEEIVLVVPSELIQQAEEMRRSLGLDKIASIVGGGSRRQDSVLNALRALANRPPHFVAVHDAARPLASPELIRRCVCSAIEKGSGVAALPVTDTLKKADTEQRVKATVDRASLWAIQTPQVFSYQTLLSAHESAQKQGLEATDDAALVEALGETVWLVRGEETNLKVTTPGDLRLVADILTGRLANARIRLGHGFDAHRCEAGRPCLLGGVHIPAEAGPIGHSDGDVLTHAIIDAILGALALGDIGQHFPDTDPAYAGVRSLDLAARVAAMVADRGYRIASVDATLIAQEPRIAPHVRKMREEIAGALNCPVECVSVKGTTTEGMGYTGRGEGIAAHAVAVLCPAIP